MSKPLQSKGKTIAIFKTANLRRRRVARDSWHRYRSQSYILRTQIGFDRVESSRPLACRGCTHYHGKSYGQSLGTRTLLVCGFHPFGWMDNSCPDWQSDRQLRQS